MKKLVLSLTLLALAMTVKAQKTLILYYSQTGVTQQVAQLLQQELGADIARIEAVEPYDGDYRATIERSRRERQEKILPEIKPLKVNVKDYDVIFLGYPIWFGTYALPVKTFVKYHSLAGKTTVPFCTFGSGGLNSSSADLAKDQPMAKVAKGYGVRAARITAAAKEVNRFLIENGYKSGKVKRLPDYGKQKPVTKADIAVFDAACSGYQYPLGTPLTVGKRKTTDSRDYKFTVKSRGMNGEDATSTIYVTVGKGKDGKPEFTEVVR